MSATITDLIEREERRLAASTQQSAAAWERARRVLPGGVASSFQRGEPWPVYVARGDGPAVWDIDGARRLDFHCGFGAMIQGHANRAIGRALAERHPLGTHFAAANENSIVVAAELARRFGLPLWRFTNSGTEATMDAIRIARGFTGRDGVVMTTGAYHGHHDAVMVRDSGGLPTAVGALTATVPYNDPDALEAQINALDQAGGRPACVILEPAMLLGVVPPAPGYLAAVREITRRYDVVLIFDEVKTGLAIAAGGAVERFGVRPDLVTLAKALGGGLPVGAVGGSEEVMSVVESGAVLQVGTFNGNPLGMAAARASLIEVLTDDAYSRLEELGSRMVAGCSQALASHRLPGNALTLGARGRVTFSSDPVVDYETYTSGHDPSLSRLAWLYGMNRGLFLAPGRPEQWTLSIAHSRDDVDAYVAVFAELCAELAGGSARGADDRTAGHLAPT